MLDVHYQKKFLKGLANIPAEFREEIEYFAFEILPGCKTLAEAKKFEKMTGYKKFFKARFGDYRIGAYSSSNYLELRCVLHRKEIYRFFP